jgi:HlyD family secretion protein
VVNEARDVVVVPNWAIRRDRDTGESYASVLRGGTVVEVPVTLGLRDEAVSEVLDGLTEGEVAAVQTTRETFSLFGGS